MPHQIALFQSKIVNVAISLPKSAESNLFPAQELAFGLSIVAMQPRWFLLGQSAWFWAVWKIVIFPPFRKLLEIAISASFPTSRNFGK